MLALARKYRPRNFASVAVQTHVSNTLKGAIARGRVAHAYLLCGPRGVGKTTLARVLAMALNCENRPARDRLLAGDAGAADARSTSTESPAAGAAEAGEPCGRCQSCQRIWSGSASLDVVEIDAASNRGVDDARELRERAMYAPSGDERYKVYIVDEAHMLTREAWNALLKILEEPPPRVVFVFATTEPQKIAQAAAPVLSRLQRFDLKRIGPADIRERLTAVLHEEGISFEADALGAIARAADGSMRDALSLTDQALSLGDSSVTVARVRDALGLVPEDEYLAVLDLIATRRAKDVFASTARLADMGVDFGTFLTGLADMLRTQLAVVLGGDPPDVSEHALAELRARRHALDASDLLRMLSALGELEPRFRKSSQQQLLLEMLLVRFALLDRSVEIEDLLREMGGGGQNAPAERADDSPPDRVGRPAKSGRSANRLDREAGPARSPVRAAPPPADAPPAASDRETQPLELNRLAERWDDVVGAVRRSGRNMVATALEHILPHAVTARGEITLQLEEANPVYEDAFAAAKEAVLEAVRTVFPSAQRVVLRPADTPAAPSPRRITEESMKADKVATLRKRDPALGAAIDALDLELLE